MIKGGMLKMRKGMMIIGICVAISFSASICFVSTSWGKEAFRPPVGSMKPTAVPPLVVTEAGVPNAVFWDLIVDHFIVAGQSFNFPNDSNLARTINVKVGQTISCQCFYKVKTIKVGDIRHADVKRWGAGNQTYTITGGLFFPNPQTHQEYKTETKTLPSFTDADVQSWKNQLGTYGRKEWTESLVYIWTVKPEDVGKNIQLYFSLNSFPPYLTETDEGNNGKAGSTGIVAKFNISTFTLEGTPVEKVK
jgi:hypothetical protein